MCRQPDFDNLLRVLDRKPPMRPTLFEFFLNDTLYEKVTGITAGEGWNAVQSARRAAIAYGRLGYDYFNCHASTMHFPTREAQHGQSSRSMNEASLIHDRASFEAYPWPDPDKADQALLDQAAAVLLPGMKLTVFGPCGVLENALAIVGYEDLCLMMHDDPALAKDVFDAIGSRLYRYYELALAHPMVGAVIVNDDWGFATQTMISPDQLRHYVFPWIRKMVELIHRNNRPAILHSCGQLAAVMDDIIDDLKFDAKHSYEDKIMPVEDFYEAYGRRIAVLGGIDLDFVCRSSPAQITQRCRAMVDRSLSRGGYALGTGNSIPAYVPHENYFAMINAALAYEPARA